MSTITKEWLQQTIAEYEANRDELPFGLDTNSSIELQAFKLALASLEAEAVAFVMADDLKDSSIISTPAYRDLGEAMERTVGDVVALYAAPPATVSIEAGSKLSNFFASQESLGGDFEKVLTENIEELYVPGNSVQRVPVSVPDFSALDRLAGEMLTHAMNCERRVAVAYTHCAHRLAEEVRDLRAAMLQGAEPVSNRDELTDGWVACSERMPEKADEVLCAKEFDGPGDWRQKVGYYLAGKWTVYSASWTPTHWMPLPAAPQQEA